MRRFVESLTPSPYGRLWAILLGTGCRLGEALAARWRDYEAATGTLTIAATLSETRTQGTMRTAPKTAAGYRRVELPFFARRILDERECELARTDEAIIQTTTGKPPSRWLVSSAFGSACKRASVSRMRVHDLRHLHASLLIGEGVPVTVVSARLGHASTAITTSVYAHALRGSEGIAALAFDGVMNGQVDRLPALSNTGTKPAATVASRILAVGPFPTLTGE
jgi:integrase